MNDFCPFPCNELPLTGAMPNLSCASSMAFCVFSSALSGVHDCQSGTESGEMAFTWSENVRVVELPNCQVARKRKATNQRSDSESVVPVSGEVGDGHSRQTGADPVEQLGFGRVVRLRAVLVMLRPAHRDRVVQNERPYQTHDQLSVVIYDVWAVWNQYSTLTSTCKSIGSTNKFLES